MKRYKTDESFGRAVENEAAYHESWYLIRLTMMMMSQEEGNWFSCSSNLLPIYYPPTKGDHNMELWRNLIRGEFSRIAVRSLNFLKSEINDSLFYTLSVGVISSEKNTWPKCQRDTLWMYIPWNACLLSTLIVINPPWQLAVTDGRNSASTGLCWLSAI